MHAFKSQFSIEWPFRIIDGDTLDCIFSGKKQRIRIFGIDTPETYKNNNYKSLASLENYYAQKAKTFLTNITRKKELNLQYITTDKYNRLVCIVKIGKLDLAKELVKRGLARVKYISIWTDKNKYWVNDSQLVKYYKEINKIEIDAQSHLRGFWKEPIQDVFHKK
ncbi:thermonuclease family protein [Mycoplasma sp. Mirounga ES2805-ORL]|uniref:thermonuclease family protein n=1 Tax=Mycoplasma sp. Mirounga ES2805-ORL TaxID=754514 RepID=UPI00197BB8B5|nr:thermonuclease family protein [Mycoplasma sp. Mirounga ES2805-ORL]QSF13487.1 thermonuclease family protein [Mycoplasma sp. Mirounga ES2805-ORL]